MGQELNIKTSYQSEVEPFVVWHSTDTVMIMKKIKELALQPTTSLVLWTYALETQLSNPCHTTSVVLPVQWYPYRLDRKKAGPIAGLNMVVKKKSLYFCWELSCSFVAVQPKNWSLHSMSYTVYNYDQIKAKINKDQS